MSKYYEEYLALSPEQKSRLYAIENDNSFDNAEEICCPYCNYQQSLEGPDVGYEQDDETKHTCQSFDCGKEFTIIAQVSYSWSTAVPDEEAMRILKEELKNG